MAHTYGTRPLSWYDAPPDDDMTEDEQEEHNRQITREIDAWCKRSQGIGSEHEKR